MPRCEQCSSASSDLQTISVLRSGTDSSRIPLPERYVVLCCSQHVVAVGGVAGALRQRRAGVGYARAGRRALVYRRLRRCAACWRAARLCVASDAAMALPGRKSRQRVHTVRICAVSAAAGGAHGPLLTRDGCRCLSRAPGAPRRQLSRAARGLSSLERLSRRVGPHRAAIAAAELAQTTHVPPLAPRWCCWLHCRSLRLDSRPHATLPSSRAARLPCAAGAHPGDARVAVRASMRDCGEFRAH